MFDRLLVPTDGSGPATAALELATKISSAAATVHLLYVSEVDKTADFVDGDQLGASERMGDEILADASELATTAGTSVVREIQRGVLETEFSSTRRATTSRSSSWALTDDEGAVDSRCEPKPRESFVMLRCLFSSFERAMTSEISTPSNAFSCQQTVVNTLTPRWISESRRQQILELRSISSQWSV